jgi:hypothetical protein
MYEYELVPDTVQMAAHISPHLGHFVCIATDTFCEGDPSVLVYCVAVNGRFSFSIAFHWHWECSVM